MPRLEGMTTAGTVRLVRKFELLKIEVVVDREGIWF
jgi:hypothetical protein